MRIEFGCIKTRNGRPQLATSSLSGPPLSRRPTTYSPTDPIDAVTEQDGKGDFARLPSALVPRWRAEAPQRPKPPFQIGSLEALRHASPFDRTGHKRTSEMQRRVTCGNQRNPGKRHHLVAEGPTGISSVKLVPMGDDGSVSSPPSCFESALTRRVPSRLLVAESKPGGRPTPSSWTDIKIAWLSD